MRAFLAGLILIALTGGVASAQAKTCGLRQPMTCGTTNDFIWVKEVQSAITAFLGDETVMEVTTVRKASAYAIASLGGPAEKPVQLDDGSTMMTACIAHSCTQKGAIVLKPGGEIAAIGLLNIQTIYPRVERTFGSHTELIIFVAKDSTKGAAVDAIEAWGKQKLEESYLSPGTRHAPLTTEIRPR